MRQGRDQRVNAKKEEKEGFAGENNRMYCIC